MAVTTIRGMQLMAGSDAANTIDNSYDQAINILDTAAFVIKDVFANRGTAAAAKSGTIFKPTDVAEALYLSDGTNWHSIGRAEAPPAVRVTKSSQVITQTVVTIITFDAETFDQGGVAMHDNVTNNSRLVAPISGTYMWGVYGLWSGGATDGTYRYIGPAKNGTALNADYAFGKVVGDHGQHAHGILRLAATDYMSFEVQHDAGSSRTLNSISAYLTYIGA